MQFDKIINRMANNEILIKKYHNPQAPYAIEEIIEKGHKINLDGTIWLYHGTTKDKADKIIKDQYFKSPPDAPDSYGIYFSTSDEVSDSYGDGTLVKALIKVKDLFLDDAFPGRDRMDFYVKTHNHIYHPVKIIK